MGVATILSRVKSILNPGFQLLGGLGLPASAPFLGFGAFQCFGFDGMSCHVAVPELHSNLTINSPGFQRYLKLNAAVGKALTGFEALQPFVTI